MKKFLLSFTLFTATLFTYAGGSCAIDSSNTNFFPNPDSIPCIERTVFYDQTIQIAIPTSVDLQDFGFPIPFVLTVDSVVITGVNGLPNGISYTPNPSNGVLYGGDKGCAQVYGTTTDNPGRYPVSFDGTFTAHGFPFPPYFDGDTTLDFATLQQLGGGMFELYVDVINPGDDCRPAASGINDFNSELNTLMKVYPNPSNGVVNVSLNSGNSFYTTFNLSNLPRGLYTVLLKTTEGIAAKNVSVE